MYTLYLQAIESDYTSQLMTLYKDYEAHYEGDCGIDLFVPNCYMVEHNQKKLIGHGIKAKMTDEDGNPVSYYLYARSSISKTPLIVHNSVGIIDAGYRGEILGAVINVLGPDYIVSTGDRLFQICAPNLGKIKVQIVDSITNPLDETARGGGGFGSTGR
jgi:dUTP pyrophosphatase